MQTFLNFLGSGFHVANELFFADTVSHDNCFKSRDSTCCDQAADGLSELHTAMIHTENGDVNASAAAGNAGLVTRFPIVISMVTGTSVYFTQHSQKRVKKIDRKTGWTARDSQS